MHLLCSKFHDFVPDASVFAVVLGASFPNFLVQIEFSDWLKLCLFYSSTAQVQIILRIL